MTATYALIPGAGGDAWYWHLVQPRLEAHGATVVAAELPAAEPTARLGDYVDVVVDAVTRRAPAHDALVVVGQSLGGLVAPLVAETMGADLIVLVAPMIPAPGETGREWWTAAGQAEAAAEYAAADGRTVDEDDPLATYYHDVSPTVVTEAMARPFDQTDGPFRDPWPLAAWPAIPTRVIAGRFDRLFPLAFVRRLARERIGVEPDVVDTGHLPALANPEALTDRLLHHAAELHLT